MAKNKSKKNLEKKPTKLENNSENNTVEANVEMDDKIKELESKLLTSLAENENLRKRFDREKEDLSNYVISNFAKEILSVLDNLQRAMASVNSNEAKDKSDGLSQLIEGIELEILIMQVHLQTRLIHLLEQTAFDKLILDIPRGFGKHLLIILQLLNRRDLDLFQAPELLQ